MNRHYASRRRMWWSTKAREWYYHWEGPHRPPWPPSAAPDTLQPTSSRVARLPISIHNAHFSNSHSLFLPSPFKTMKKTFLPLKVQECSCLKKKKFLKFVTCLPPTRKNPMIGSAYAGFWSLPSPISCCIFDMTNDILKALSTQTYHKRPVFNYDAAATSYRT